ncbi:MAG: hypothetical protein D4S01_00075 [Dehalococcoidia bacterium]|nr:MAG: hypothetical protein D4S01_00075 [Dehalococcoidia bacterium]
MTVDLWGIIGTSVSVAVAILVYVLTKRRTEEVHRWTQRRTEEILEFIVNLVPSSAVDPKTVRRLLDDYNKTKEWRGKVSRNPDGTYHIDWEP